MSEYERGDMRANPAQTVCTNVYCTIPGCTTGTTAGTWLSRRSDSLAYGTRVPRDGERAGAGTTGGTSNFDVASVPQSLGQYTRYDGEHSSPAFYPVPSQADYRNQPGLHCNPAPERPMGPDCQPLASSTPRQIDDQQSMARMATTRYLAPNEYPPNFEGSAPSSHRYGNFSYSTQEQPGYRYQQGSLSLNPEHIPQGNGETVSSVRLPMQTQSTASPQIVAHGYIRTRQSVANPPQRQARENQLAPADVASTRQQIQQCPRGSFGRSDLQPVRWSWESTPIQARPVSDHVDRSRISIEQLLAEPTAPPAANTNRLLQGVAAAPASFRSRPIHQNRGRVSRPVERSGVRYLSDAQQDRIWNWLLEDDEDDNKRA